MVVSKKLLSQWIDIAKIKDEDVAKALNNLGFEVEKVINLSSINTNLIVGEVIKVEKHPKLERLNLCDVSIGKGSLKIVCGASNVSEKLKVVVAQIGSSLANGMVISERNLQGVVSQGMICSLIELGLHTDVLSEEELQGIVHLPNNAKVGSSNPLTYLDLDDTIFEIQLTINRSDCLAMYSIAQELSSYFKLSLKTIKVSNLSKLKSSVKQIKTNNSLVNALASLSIKLLDTTPLNLENSVRRTLQLANVKPINFINDLINLVMLELGQPLLAFNNSKIKDQIAVGVSKGSQDSELKVFKNDIVLYNKDLIFHNLGLATSPQYEVQKNDSTIILISINASLVIIQEQLKRHNNMANTLLLQRLSKPIVPDHYLLVLQRVLFLLDEKKVNYQLINFTNDIIYKISSLDVKFNWNKINQILGTSFSLTEITTNLKRTGCLVTPKGKEELRITCPSHRNDLNNVNDFSEEIGRVVSYDSLPVTKPILLVNLQPKAALDNLISELRCFLLNNGFHHAKTYNLTSKADLEGFNFFNYNSAVTLASPLSSAREVMRFSLVESLINISYYNLVHKQNNLKFFCDDVIYTTKTNQHHLAFIVSSQDSNKNNFYLIKGVLEAFLNKKVTYNFSDLWSYNEIKNSSKIHPSLSANISFNKTHFATIGSTHPELNRQLSLDNTFFVEINCTRLVAILEELKKDHPIKFKNWPKFNFLSRDISITINKKTNFLNIKQLILKSKINNLVDVSLVDIYSDEALILKNQHALTFNFQFNSQEEQLNEAKISSQIETIQSLLTSEFNAKIR